MRHAFVDSGERHTDARGRLLKVCAECGRVNLGPNHTVSPKPATVPEPLHTPLAMAMIEMAINTNVLMLEHTDVSWGTRIQVVEANRRLRQEIAPQEISDLQPERTPLTSRVIPKATSRAKVAARGINDPKMRALAVRAISEGWTLRKTGSHWRLEKAGSDPITFGTTVSDHRAWRNTRATAKRRGIDVKDI